MFLVEGTLRWSASDLTAAAECEYALLRALDVTLGRTAATALATDPLEAHVARLGDRHEERLLADYRARGTVIELPRAARPYGTASIQAATDAALKAFLDEPDVVYQPALSDGEFFGYADFVERTDVGWVVCDAKLARSAKPKALIQLGAYADQVRRLDLPLAPTVALLLGNGERAEFPVADVLPVFADRRERLREIVAEHLREDASVAWGDERYVACGVCGECQAAADHHDDVILVAGLRMDQRHKLRTTGIVTMADLAEASTGPRGMAASTFEKLRAQAALQEAQRQAGPGAAVTYELTADAPTMLALLPAPSAGDLFFDLEGDPLYDEDDPTRVGLEYLWGMVGVDERYEALWAHDSHEERAAFVAFMDLLAARRQHHPDMHVYHYAPYETSALKRLAMRYQTKEAELDDLLRADVFVDLYATVRGSVRVSQPSYSIKKLEPLYMGRELRESDVADGAGSVVAYQEFRELRADDPGAAQERLDALADYNRYDCVSTLRLRDWLLDRAAEAGVRDQIVARTGQTTRDESDAADEVDPTFTALMARSRPEQRLLRTPEEQAYAMLATSLDYYRRETKQFWWDHFERLGHPVDDWSNARDVFVVDSAVVLSDWEVPGGRKKNARRTLRLVGAWTPGSKAGAAVQVVYATPAPPRAYGPDGAPYAAASALTVEADPDGDPRVVLLTEGRPPDETFAALPLALVPAPPPRADNIVEAIAEVARSAVTAPTLPATAALDLLARRLPRLRDGGPLPSEETATDTLVAALTSMSDSYVAVQGPPGTGKTWTGSRVVKTLVESYHWRIGVVAQSHAVVENMLTSMVEAGLDPSLVGKPKAESPEPAWTPLTTVRSFLGDHVATGCVVGGTAWDFANASTVPRDSLDLLVVDEAGQFSVAPTIGVSVAARRLLLLGDPQQLPQVSQGSHAEPVDESALGWIMDGYDTLPPELGCFLGASYRMHPTLCREVSLLSYDGRLAAAAPAAERSLEGVAPGVHVVEIDHTGNRVSSPEEAAAVVEIVRAHLGVAWSDPDDPATPRSLAASDVLVVAPYNAQVTMVRDALDAVGLGDVRVGTVDKFQGQQAPLAILTMTASSHGDVPRGMGFLLSRNRINVAISRAQWRAVIVRSTTLTSFMPTTTSGVLELGAFLRLGSPNPGLSGAEVAAEPSGA